MLKLFRTLSSPQDQAMVFAVVPWNAQTPSEDDIPAPRPSTSTASSTAASCIVGVLTSLQRVMLTGIVAAAASPGVVAIVIITTVIMIAMLVILHYCKRHRVDDANRQCYL